MLENELIEHFEIVICTENISFVKITWDTRLVMVKALLLWHSKNVNPHCLNYGLMDSSLKSVRYVSKRRYFTRTWIQVTR